MDALAAYGTADTTLFPFAQIKQKVTGNTAPKLAREAAVSPEEDATRFDMSFSGIKTAARRYVELHHMQPAIALREQAFRALGLHKAKPDEDQHHPSPAAHRCPNSQPHRQLPKRGRQEPRARDLSMPRNITESAASSSAEASPPTATCARSSPTPPMPQASPSPSPSVALSTDNAAMIAAAAWPKFLARQFAPDTLEPTPQLRLG